MAAAEPGPRRMRPARVVIPVVLGLLVLVAVGARLCSPEPAVDQARAVAITTDAAGFPVVEHQVRFVRQGIRNEPAWVVGVKAADGTAMTFLIDGRDGSIDRVDATAPE
ncbi:MAG: hypothetical protein ACKO7U_04340 [Actinomycetota bacterium]